LWTSRSYPQQVCFFFLFFLLSYCHVVTPFFLLGHVRDAMEGAGHSKTEADFRGE
jgi:hypothetical protein